MARAAPPRGRARRASTRALGEPARRAFRAQHRGGSRRRDRSRDASRRGRGLRRRVPPGRDSPGGPAGRLLPGEHRGNAPPARGLRAPCTAFDPIRPRRFPRRVRALGDRSSRGDPFEPVEAYGASKAEAERVTLSFAGRLPVAVARPPRITGPGDRENLLLFRLAARRILLSPSGPARPLSFVDVEDCARGMLLLAERPEAVGEAFFLARPDRTDLEGLQREPRPRSGSSPGACTSRPERFERREPPQTSPAGCSDGTFPSTASWSSRCSPPAGPARRGRRSGASASRRASTSGSRFAGRFAGTATSTGCSAVAPSRQRSGRRLPGRGHRSKLGRDGLEVGAIDEGRQRVAGVLDGPRVVPELAAAPSRTRERCSATGPGRDDARPVSAAPASSPRLLLPGRGECRAGRAPTSLVALVTDPSRPPLAGGTGRAPARLGLHRTHPWPVACGDAPAGTKGPCATGAGPSLRRARLATGSRSPRRREGYRCFDIHPGPRLDRSHRGRHRQGGVLRRGRNAGAHEHRPLLRLLRA